MAEKDGKSAGLAGITGMLKSLVSDSVLDKIPSQVKETVMLRSFGLLKIPMLFFISPTVIELDDEKCVVRVPLTRRSMNHLRSMYFGALAAGADCAGGLIAMRLIQTEGKGQASLIFKDFHADFLKRAEGDVHFTCTQGTEIQAMVRKALETGERENMAVHVTATVPSKLGEEPVAQFILTLSIKKKAS
jgi:acyl-coenzyme A thioesterase PaaI-like protein